MTEVEIDAIINTDRSNQGLKDLRKGLKELISLQSQVAAGSDQFKRLQKAINDTEGRIGDLTDSFNTLRGSGVERVTSSLSLFREGLATADTEKLKIGLQGLGAAMKAIPIFLLIEGIRLLIDNFSVVVDFVKEITGSFSEEEKELRRLNEQYEKQIIASSILSTSLENEISLLKAKKAPLGDILVLEQKLYDVRLSDLKLELQREKARAAEISSTTTLTQKILGFFGAVTNNQNLIFKANQDKINNLQETANKITEITNNIAKLETEKEVNKITTLEEIRQKAEQDRRRLAEATIANIRDEKKREIDLENEKYRQLVFDATGNAKLIEQIRITHLGNLSEIFGKYAEQEREAQDKLNQESYQNELAHNADMLKILEDSTLEREIFKEESARQDEQDEKQREARRRRDLENDMAYRNVFEKKSLNQQIDEIEKIRDTELLNEELNQKQRVAIIEKAENDIFQLRTKKAQEYISYATAAAQVVDGINTLTTQKENYNLSQQQYARDAALEMDAIRTEEKLSAEEDYTDRLLANDNLTSEQRSAITQGSENRQKKIVSDSKNAQLAIGSDFSKKEVEIRKKQFERQKAIQIATGVINTAAAVLQTLASVPYPANIPLAILAGAAGVIQVGIIASQKFDDGGAGTAANLSPVIASTESPSIRGGTPSSPSPTPSFNPQALGTMSSVPTSEEIKESGERKVWVSETDIRIVSEKVDVYEARSTFGG